MAKLREELQQAILKGAQLQGTNFQTDQNLNSLRTKRETIVSERIIREEEARLQNELNKDLTPAFTDPNDLLICLSREATDRLTRHNFVNNELAPLISLYAHQL